MKFKEFHKTMMYNEFGEGGITNNYYLLFGLIFMYIIFMVIGVWGWLIYLTQ